MGLFAEGCMHSKYTLMQPIISKSHLSCMLFGKSLTTRLLADGQVSRTPTCSCHWIPPNNSVTDSFLYALYTMPDCCYVFCPIAIPTDHMTMPMAGMSIESGCLHAPGRFQRTILKYSQDGRLTDMVHETYMRWASDGVDASTRE